MGHFDRSNQPKRTAPVRPAIPERLQRLDREMQQGKDFEYLYATRRDHRIRICVTRIAKIDSPADYRFVATCSVGGRVHRCFGHVPSQAVGRLITQLSHAVSRLDFERNMIASGRVAA